MNRKIYLITLRLYKNSLKNVDKNVELRPLQFGE
nr:MAG TPA: hypothetical protein [Caudoviricetes sp.]